LSGHGRLDNITDEKAVFPTYTFTPYCAESALDPSSLGIYMKGKIYPCALTEHHAMKAYWGNGGTAPLIL
jgi:hypothetical protein